MAAWPDGRRHRKTYAKGRLDGGFGRRKARQKRFAGSNDDRRLVFGGECVDGILPGEKGDLYDLYPPRGRPSTEKDLSTLLHFGSAATDVTFANDRFRGAGNVKHYPVARDAVLCWAGVYTGALLELPTRTVAKLGDGFLRLDALTRDGATVETP